MIADSASDRLQYPPRMIIEPRSGRLLAGIAQAASPTTLLAGDLWHTPGRLSMQNTMTTKTLKTSRP
jgi:hypothetical protein